MKRGRSLKPDPPAHIIIKGVILSFHDIAWGDKIRQELT